MITRLLSTYLLALATVCLAVAQETATSGQPTPRLENDAPAPTFGTTVVIPSGLRGEIYAIPDRTMLLPRFSSLGPIGDIWTTMLNIPPRHWREGFPGVTSRDEWFAINYTGKFWIAKPGPYAFALLSDDGSKLYIDDQLIIDNDCQHPPAVMGAGIILKGGLHRIRVSYFQGPRDCLALVLAVRGPGERWRPFSTDEFKPPSNPEDWTFADTSNTIILEDPNWQPGHLKLRDLIGEPVPPRQKLTRKERREETGAGCMWSPFRNCGS